MSPKSRSDKSVLLVGNWNQDIYEEALGRGFKETGWNVIPFNTRQYIPCGPIWDQLLRLRLGCFLKGLNSALVDVASSVQPELIFILRGDGILPWALELVKSTSPETKIMTYHNDNPYIDIKRRFIWRHYLRSLEFAHLSLVYRPSDIEQTIRAGAKRVEILPPNYIRDRHLPTVGGEPNDVVFIGHYEKDGRDVLLQRVHDAGIEIRVFGTQWSGPQRRMGWLAKQEIRRVWGRDYSALLTAAKIALVFLSGSHKDVYTRRCFEIPACGTLMMAPRTKELESYFIDGEEAVFWDSEKDLVGKLKFYLENDKERARVAAAGRARVLRDGHDEISRAAFIGGLYAQISNPSVVE